MHPSGEMLIPAVRNRSLRVAGVVLAATVIAVGSSTGQWAASLLAALALIVLALVAAELRLRLRLRRLTDDARQLAGIASPGGAVWPTDPLAELKGLAPKIEARLAQAEAQLRDEARRRAQAEEDLRESQERYALAVTGANDGMWEWNYRTRRAFFSPRAKSMLGYAESEIGDDVEEWQARVHPDDLKRALTDLQAHLDGHSQRFELEHRMLHKDGTWRWVLARAAVVRHASGKPERLIGLYTDVTARKQVQEVLLELADGLNGRHGEDAYAALVEKLAMLVGAREAFLTECCDYPTTRVRMLAYWQRGQPAPLEEFQLAGTPCEQVIATGQPLFVPHGASARWSDERQWGTEAYLGLPCLDTKGTVIGHLACKHGEPITRAIPHEAILKLFAVRASVEIERHFLERMRGAFVDPAARSGVTLH